MSMPEPRTSNADRLEHADVLTRLDAGHASQNAAVFDSASRIAQLESELESTKSTLLIEQSHAQELQEQLKARDAASAANDTAHAKSSFNVVMELSSEREAALRERKLYKERAENAEAQIAELESDLSAVHAKTKVQAERIHQLSARCEELQRTEASLRTIIAALEAKQSTGGPAADVPQSGAANGAGSVTSLHRLVQDRENKIAELEMQLVDRAGAPTLVGGDLERLAAGLFPKVVYALESLDAPGEVHTLSRPTNTVGRSHDNDIAIASSSISRFHARLQYKADGVWLTDLQSVNGCKVNGKRTSNQQLNDGDLVIIGHSKFRFSQVAK
jgi:hypothetical protein